MKRKRKGLVVLAIVAMVAILGVGYAAITNVGFTINGSASAEGDQSAFKVHFSAVDFDGAEIKTAADKITHNETQDDAHSGTFSISGLTTQGDNAQFVYTVKNDSTDLSAVIPKDSINVSSLTGKAAEYFTVSVVSENPRGDVNIAPGASSTFTVNVTLNKTPIEKVDTGDLTVTFAAKPSDGTNA